MLVSILHRATGTAMATAGVVTLVWWLVAAASGRDSYARFLDTFTYSDGRLNALGWLFGIGFTWSFFTHLANGVRHLFMDIGANFELRGNKRSSTAVVGFGVIATLAYWAFMVGAR